MRKGNNRWSYNEGDVYPRLEAERLASLEPKKQKEVLRLEKELEKEYKKRKEAERELYYAEKITAHYKNRLVRAIETIEQMRAGA